MSQRKVTPQKVIAILLNYNGMEHLSYCIPSLLATRWQPFELLVVDNASQDASIEWLREHYPGVNILQSDRNRGWSGGNNLGIHSALSTDAEYIVLVNNDIRVHPGWIDAAVTLAQTDTRIGIIGFRIFGWGSRGNLQEYDTACRAWSLENLQAQEADNVSGCALFASRKVYESIGVFDEGFFAYGDENDFELRAQRAGFKMLASNAPVWHYAEGSFGRIPIQAARYAMRAELRLAIKYGSKSQVLRKLFSMINLACNPFLTVDMGHAPTHRGRPGNLLLNGALIAEAVRWNLWHFSETLKRRQEDLSVADRARLMLWGP